ncbi:FxsC protein [Actinomycetes bacterium KLBMP 9797]
MRYFFLSYSPGDDDLHVARFFVDLSAAVRRELEVGPERTVGFLDDGDRSEHWPSEVRTELATCQTLVVLCSPKLLLDKRCGRVWTVFGDRLERYERATGQHAPALIPVAWSGQGLPVGFDAPQAAAPYPPAVEDVRMLVRLHSRQAAYRDLMASLARRIVETSHQHHIPPAPPEVDLRTARDAFEPWRDRLDGAERPQYVHIVVAAGTRDQMRVVRQDVRFYGDRQEDWAPYQPSAPQPLGSRAQGVAAARRYGSEVVAIGAIGERIARAQARNEIIVVLVDAWIAGLAPFREALAAVDGIDESAVAVLVPTSRDDAETSDRRAELHVDVLKILPHCARRRDPLFRIDIETPGGFDDDLAAALEEAQNWIFAKGRVFRPPPGGPASTRPILEGP